LSQVLYRLADALEAGEDAQQAREAASAGPKSTANLLAWLPVAGLGLAHMLGASIGQLLTSGTGWILLISGAALAAVGRIWTRRMMKTAEEP
ncbi:MAG: type II secretion system F family protein, partial [Yaniella sp.]